MTTDEREEWMQQMVLQQDAEEVAEVQAEAETEKQAEDF
jgi:hypothetical protein